MIFQNYASLPLLCYFISWTNSNNLRLMKPQGYIIIRIHHRSIIKTQTSVYHLFWGKNSKSFILWFCNFAFCIDMENRKTFLEYFFYNVLEFYIITLLCTYVYHQRKMYCISIIVMYYLLCIVSNCIKWKYSPFKNVEQGKQDKRFPNTTAEKFIHMTQIFWLNWLLLLSWVNKQ